jgi:hypothetical protein
MHWPRSWLSVLSAFLVEPPLEADALEEALVAAEVLPVGAVMVATMAILTLVPLVLGGAPVWELLFDQPLDASGAAMLITLLTVPVLHATFVPELQEVRWSW